MARSSASTSTLDRYAEHNANTFSNQTQGSALSWKQSDEARGQALVPLNTGKKYVFRTLPGMDRGFAIKVPALPDSFKSEAQRERYTRDYIRRRKQIDGENPKFDLESVHAKTGGWIQFSSIPGNGSRQTTAFYATDDKEIHDFLMHLKSIDETGKWQHIVVEYPNKTFDIGGQKFPATDAGFEAAKIAAMQGLNDESGNGESDVN